MQGEVMPDSYYRQLYERFCQGEQQAGIELVNVFGNRLLQYIRRTSIYSDFEAAEDCVQNTWIKLVQHCGKSLRSGTSFWGFVSTIARNQAIDDYRAATRQKRSPVEQVEYQEDYHQDEGGGMNDQADPARVLELLEASQGESQRLNTFKYALASLPQQQNLALSLQLAGYSIKEIADHLNEKDETVKSRLRYAKNKLKQLLSESQEPDANAEEVYK